MAISIRKVEGRPAPGLGVFDHRGKEISGVMAVDVRIRPGEPATANIEMLIEDVSIEDGQMIATAGRKYLMIPIGDPPKEGT